MGIVAAFCVGLTKAGFNGCGLITVLLMTQIMPAKESTGAVLPMLIAADLMAIGIYRRHVDWRVLAGLIPSTFLGLLSGWFLMSRIPDRFFGHLLGWMILAMMLVVLWQRFDRRILAGFLHHPALATGSGFFAGITTMMANAGGPAMTFYLLAKNFDKMAFVGTCAWFFFLTNLAKVPLSWSLGLITRSSLMLNLALLPAVVFGVIAGRYLIGKIPQGPFDGLLLVMSTAVAIRLVFA
jgi:uncharacterized protein